MTFVIRKSKDFTISLVREMIAKWPDQVLAEKTPRDLVASYGLGETQAERLLWSERFSRGMKEQL